MMYVLLKKLTTTNNTKQLRSSVCKSLLLVPVFGIHYIFYIVPFDPFESCATYQFIFHYVMIITEALQGSIVTAVFCLFNQEVRMCFFLFLLLMILIPFSFLFLNNVILFIDSYKY